MRAPVAYALSRPSALARARTHAPTRCHSLLAPGASTTARVRRKPAPSTPGIAGYAGAGHVDFAREHAFAADLAREGAFAAAARGPVRVPRFGVVGFLTLNVLDKPASSKFLTKSRTPGMTTDAWWPPYALFTPSVDLRKCRASQRAVKSSKNWCYAYVSAAVSIGGMEGRNAAQGRLQSARIYREMRSRTAIASGTDQRRPLRPNTSRGRSPIDPSRLCPFCDAELPPVSSLVLERLLQQARTRSVLRPKPNNPGARKARMDVYVGLCHRHDFESKLLPTAVSNGWPTRVDFDGLPARVQNFRSGFDAILREPRSSSFFVEEVERRRDVGERVAESAMGQYAASKGLPVGYYGVKGSMIIHWALCKMYPDAVLSEKHERIEPLIPSMFLACVMVPEASVMLIMEDRKTTHAEALKIMWDSSNYGTMMFPDDDEVEDDE
ncbi:hypothetical protein AURDEDRAFT_172110 [Auricularia subglabra TFB-10046 SS5]|nr:hypothetical protein AURDEDRAFT_172110 [Auricularia subglabra TFB-10046 SS5]